MPGSYVLVQLEESPRYEDAPTITPYQVGASKLYLPVRSASLARGVQHQSLRDETRGTNSEPPRLISGYEPTGALQEYLYSNQFPTLATICGLQGTVQAGAGTNAKHTLTGTGTITGGTFIYTAVVGKPTAPVPASSTAAQFQAYLEAALGAGNVKVTGGPITSTPYVIEFTGDYCAQVVAVGTINAAALTGTTPGITPTVTQAGVVGAVTDLDGKGVPTGAYLWSFVKRTGSTPRTAQITHWYEPQTLCRVGQGYVGESFTLNAGGELNINLLGLVLKEITEPGNTPTFDSQSIRPLREGDFSVSWGPSGTACTNAFEMTLTNSYERARCFDGSRSYFSKVIRTTGEPSVLTGTVTKDYADVDDLAAELTASTWAGRARWRGESLVGSSGARYAAIVDAPACQVVGADVDDMKNASRFGNALQWFAAYSEASGYDYKLQTVCGVAGPLDYS